MAKIQQAAFRDAEGQVVGTGAFHNIDDLPLEFQVAEEGFLDNEGHFLTREQAAEEAGLHKHAAESEEIDLCKSFKDYEFEEPKVKTEPGPYRIAASHLGKPVGTLTFSMKPHSQYPGYHAIESADVHPHHRGEGVYGHLIQLASSFVKTKLNGKGLVSPSEWRSEKATGAWDRLNAQGVKFQRKNGKEGPDFFLHEKDETDLKHLEHEFDVEFDRWLKARQEGRTFAPREAFDFTKAEDSLASLLSEKGGNLYDKTSDDHHEVARQMAGYNPETSPEFTAARFLAGGQIASEDAVRLAIVLYDNDFELAALRAYGLPRNEKYREMLRNAVEMFRHTGALEKSGDVDAAAIPRDIEAVLPSGKDVQEALERSQEAGSIKPVQLDPSAKHSKGTALATDPKDGKKWLIKPGSGKLSPSAGVREELANQSQREVAFYKIVEAMGIGEYYPRAELISLDHNETAVMELLGTDYTGLDKARRMGKLDPVKLFEPHLEDGSLYKWAFADWVTGNPDRHANNLMVDLENDDIKLIDHGSAFAGPAFDPAHDQKSFVPYYLRAYTDLNWAEMDAEDRVNEMPRLLDGPARQFKQWVDSINEAEIAQILTSYGIAQHATIQRLQQLKAAEDPAKLLRELWSGVLS